MFHMCWALSDGSPKLIPIDEQPDHQIVHLFRLGKAPGATHEPLHPRPEIAVLEQHLESLRRNRYAPNVICETNILRSQGVQPCAPSQATFPRMRCRP